MKLLWTTVLTTAMLSVFGAHHFNVNLEADMTLTPIVEKDGLSLKKATWGKNVYVVTTPRIKLDENEFRKFHFSFVPQEDGNVTLYLRGPYRRVKGKKQLEQYWVHYTDVEVKGGKLLNGDFKQRNPENYSMPANWKGRISWNAPEPELVSENGKNIIIVWHEAGLTQTIQVKRDVPIEVTFSAKAGEYVPAEK